MFCLFCFSFVCFRSLKGNRREPRAITHKFCVVFWTKLRWGTGRFTLRPIGAFKGGHDTQHRIVSIWVTLAFFGVPFFRVSPETTRTSTPISLRCLPLGWFERESITTGLVLVWVACAMAVTECEVFHKPRVAIQGHDL